MSASSDNKPDLSVYIALGDSITSGYADGALYYGAQRYSYAGLLAEQFKIFGGGEFRQPFMDENSPGINASGTSRLVLKKVNGNGSWPQLGYASPHGDIEAFRKNIFSSYGPFHNLGIPGAKATTLLAPGLGDRNRGAGNYNPFFTRMAASETSSSILSDALSLQHTFFTLFIGNNDAMLYALTGGTSNEITPVDGPPGQGFKESLHYTVNTLTQKKQKGALANLPDPLSLPFFTTIPPVIHRALKTIDPKTGREVMLSEGDLVLFDVLLEHDRQLYLSGAAPLPKKYVLFKEQVNEVRAAIWSYNNIIKNTAEHYHLAFVDVNAILRTAKTDRIFDEDKLTVNYRHKGLFSLDGVHISPFGQALLANEFIKAINATYRSHIPLLNSLKYPGINFP